MSFSTKISILFLLVPGFGMTIAEPLCAMVFPQGSMGILFRGWIFVAITALTVKLALAAEERRHREVEARLARAAIRDPLTSLLNRGAFDSHVEAALERARRSGSRFGIAFLDLDGFKVANDRFGHAFGDAVLIGVAERLRDLVRKADIVARLGGDEFAVLIEPAAGGDMDGFVRRLERAFQTPLNIEGMAYPVALSAGTACFPGHGEGRQALLKAADAAMYREKRQKGERRPVRRASMEKPIRDGGSTCSVSLAGWS